MVFDEHRRSSASHPRARPDARIAIVVARWHEDLTGAMLASAQEELLAAGVRPSNLQVVWVPGSFELPIVAARAAVHSDSVLAFGVVIQGETQHDHWVAHAAVTGLVLASLQNETPIHLGVLTCKTMEQARARALPPSKGGEQDKGREVARAALETLAALDGIDDWD
ncbi:MAG: 6,7-dimethyl-8-ribityllumazine synthase [Planctomycetes bacterium]|nr:6,7-dimethyl-8-ribityllumazine synthase [Planctomycetota bacterium]